MYDWIKEYICYPKFLCEHVYIIYVYYILYMYIIYIYIYIIYICIYCAIEYNKGVEKNLYLKTAGF